MTIELNIFTNCTASAPDTGIIKQTYDSFVETFGEIPTNIYCDINPNLQAKTQYLHNLTKIYKGGLYISDSLSDGYIKSIQNSEADYLFQLEHDWIFNNNIYHNLYQITEFMSLTGCYHFRFNKRPNIIAGWDKRMDESEFMGIKYCSCNNISNNPHIIDRRYYEKHLFNIIKVVPGSKGIEEELNKHNLTTCIYGGAGYPATIFHTDGKGK